MRPPPFRSPSQSRTGRDFISGRGVSGFIDYLEVYKVDVRSVVLPTFLFLAMREREISL